MAGQRKKAVPSKMCLRCGQVLPLTDFYLNKSWSEQHGRDAWCKKCAGEYCVTKERIKEYCWYNNRKWSEAHWEKAVEKAQYPLSVNAEYLSAKTSKTRKAEIEERAICRQFFCIMNFHGMYVYSDNIRPDEPVTPYSADSSSGKMEDKSAAQMLEDATQELVYSEEWNGYYTRRHIKYLDDYYADLEREFDLSDRNIKDYARKVAKAS